MKNLYLGLGLGVGGGGPIAQGLAILRSFGSDAHLYLPGIGYVSGVDAGNYLDTAYAAASVDGPVGVVLDAVNQTRGPEIVTDPAFDTAVAWVGSTTGSGTWSVSGGVGTVDSPDGSHTELMSTGLPPVAVGRTYEVVYEVISTTGGGVRVDFGGVVGTARTVPGVYREIRTSVNTTTRPVIVRGASGAACSGAITSFSIREITGSIPVINTTTAQKPILRREPILGPELVTNGGPIVGTTGWTGISGATLSNVGGELVISAPGGTNFPGANQTIATEIGKTYELTFEGRRGTAANNFGFNVTNATPVYNGIISSTTNVTVRHVFTATSTTSILNPFNVGNPASAGTIIFSKISVREIVGYANRYSWEGDGTQRRLNLSALPFQPTDEHVIVCAAKIGSIGLQRTLFAMRSTASNNPISQLVIGTSGAAVYQIRNDANTSAQSASGALVSNDSRVVTGRFSGGSMSVRVDGAAFDPKSPPGGSFTLTNAAIGCSPSASPDAFFNGQIAGLAIVKGAITDAELLTLERMLAAFQGRTI